MSHKHNLKPPYPWDSRPGYFTELARRNNWPPMHWINRPPQRPPQ